MKGRRFAMLLALTTTALVSSFTAMLGLNRATVKSARTSTLTSLDVHLHIPIWQRPRLINTIAPTTLNMAQSESGVVFERRDSFIVSPFGQVFNWLQQQVSWISVLKSIILPSVISFILVNIFNVHPAMALASNTAINKSKNNKKVATDAGLSYATTQLPVWYRRLRKLLFKPMDYSLSVEQRYDVSNGVSARLIVFLFIGAMVYGSVASQISEKYAEWRLVKEVKREKQYRELMVYDAIKLIRQKLAEPKLKSSVRDDLMKQLRELDPKGEIVAHLDGKGPKPNLSEFIDMMTNNAAGKNKKKNAGMKRKKTSNKTPPSPPAATSRSTTPPNTKSAFRGDDEDEERQEEDGDKDFEFDERKLRLDEERARRDAMTSISPSTASNNDKDGIEKGSENDVIRLMNELRDSMNEEFSGADLARLTRNLKDRLMSQDSSKRAATMRKIEQKLEDSSYWQAYLEKL